jgi:hypothetical protein
MTVNASGNYCILERRAMLKAYEFNPEIRDSEGRGKMARERWSEAEIVCVGTFLSPLRGYIIFHSTHGLRRGLYSFAASRLTQ